MGVGGLSQRVVSRERNCVRAYTKCIIISRASFPVQRQIYIRGKLNHGKLLSYSAALLPPYQFHSKYMFQKLTTKRIMHYDTQRDLNGAGHPAPLTRPSLACSGRFLCACVFACVCMCASKHIRLWLNNCKPGLGRRARPRLTHAHTHTKQRYSLANKKLCTRIHIHRGKLLRTM